LDVPLCPKPARIVNGAGLRLYVVHRVRIECADPLELDSVKAALDD